MKTENVTGSVFRREVVSLIPATVENTELDSKYFRQICVLGINIFYYNESLKVSSISGCPLRHGQRSSEERRPRKWYNKFRGGICCYTHASEKPSCFVLFSFPVVKAFLTEAKEEFNSKWEHPSQVRIFSCTLVNYRVVSSFGFNKKYIHLFHVQAFVG